MAGIRKIFSEKGLVLGIEFKVASEANKFRNSKGEDVELKAKPDRFVVKVASSSVIDKDKGMATPSYQEIETLIGEELFIDINNGKLKYLDEVNVDLEMTLSGIKVLGVTRIEKANK